jgi:hypothetical protein
VTPTIVLKSKLSKRTYTGFKDEPDYEYSNTLLAKVELDKVTSDPSKKSVNITRKDLHVETQVTGQVASSYSIYDKNIRNVLQLDSWMYTLSDPFPQITNVDKGIIKRDKTRGNLASPEESDDHVSPFEFDNT